MVQFNWIAVQSDFKFPVITHNSSLYKLSQRLHVSFDYRPQTKFAKVMFSQVSVCPWGVHGRGGMPGRGWYMWQGACVAGNHAWQRTCMAGGMRGRRDGHCSRRYASYWNAFLFFFKNEELCKSGCNTSAKCTAGLLLVFLGRRQSVSWGN